MIVRRLNPTWSAWANPFSDFDRMRRDMLRLLDSFSGDQPEYNWAGVFPPLNVSQDQDSYFVRAEMPGVDPKDLELTAVNRTLTITGRRQVDVAEGASYHRRERPDGDFSRTVTLPGDFDLERVAAKHANGLLTVTLAKPEQAKPRQIAVKTA